ncbi:hypothetical protein RHGRI_027377 [Rhododendron griersonianum]|uniref:Alpha-1,6-glucosidases pullulanase-type C-terminal domain-containing protein n=1 Tax=Rhododendron griersonianum TaxID=479676 RepID=A0AAV6J184_9ERIC|nr:hypothetical protein RHGRI_027377 [Rhododendron griersonianum]
MFIPLCLSPYFLSILSPPVKQEKRKIKRIMVTSVHIWLTSASKQVVRACIYEDPLGRDPVEIVTLKESNGVWCAIGPRSWEGCYYVYEVSVYHSSTLRIEKCIANDPYARGLSSDGRRTLFVDLDSDALKPKGWCNLADDKPILHSFSDISIYELHIRDFSVNDPTVDADFRGGYLAFTSQITKCWNHYHLIQMNSRLISQPFKMKMGTTGGKISFLIVIASPLGNGVYYDPVLWGVPKGSYASNPNGPCRTIEFRKMVQALNCIGLRVVLDVVYNHLHGSGPFDENSVLDKIVPGYYLRLNRDGCIEQSTCVNNTASEHFMVDRLILDDLLCWVVQYKVDGFRFDLMGHIMKRTMVKATNVLNGLSKDTSGVDGSSIYIYGEGWDFGEVEKNRRGVNASQFNLRGTGIGSFNDRIRDALLGGSPFGHPLQQGFVTGLLLQPNDHNHGSKADQERTLAGSKDHIQVGMAANLRDFVLTNCDGQEVKGSEVLTYGGSPVAYALSPTETVRVVRVFLMNYIWLLSILLPVIHSSTSTRPRDQLLSLSQVNYVSAHDNETLFDIVTLKTPIEMSIDERCRLNHLATSIIALSQGIPFFHAGDEMLRSKSLDRDSYNSGDWFNRLDFSYNSNNWGVGLPPREKNEKSWPLIKPRIGDPSFKPQSTHILSAVENFLNVLRIRYSSPLFHLRTANAIQQRVRFLNTGPSWIPGVIVMSIEDGHEGVPGLSQLDPIYSYIVVMINVCPTAVSFAIPTARTRTFELHPVQVVSSDEIVRNSTYEALTGCFTVPPRTTSVFVEPRNT